MRHEQDRSQVNDHVAGARRAGRPWPGAGGRSCRSGKGRGALCGGGDAGHRRADRPRRSRRSDRAAVHSERRGTGGASRARTPIRSAITPIRRSPASCIAIPTGCCSSWFMSARCIAGSVFAAKWSGRARRPRCREAAYDEALDYIRAHPEIWEVILTGGDPLMLSPRRLAEIMADLAGIDHVRIIRIHTRVPVAEPSRISGEMIAALKVEGATTWVALHANHARELTGKARAACAGIIDAGIPDGEPVGAAARRQRRRRGAGSADAGLRRMPDQALLPASRRSRARHRASAHHAGARAGADAQPAGTGVRTVPAGICARYSRRPRQVAGRSELSVAGKFFVGGA